MPPEDRVWVGGCAGSRGQAPKGCTPGSEGRVSTRFMGGGGTGVWEP